MTVEAVLGAGRMAHLKLMIDACNIDRPVAGSFDTSTGDYTTTYLPMYTGACRVRGPVASGAGPQEVQAADAEQSRSRLRLLLPHGSAVGVAAGDRVQITAGSLLGTTYSVVGVEDTTTMTARSILIEVVDDPADPAYDADGGTPADPGDLVLDGGGV